MADNSCFFICLNIFSAHFAFYFCRTFREWFLSHLARTHEWQVAPSTGAKHKNAIFIRNIFVSISFGFIFVHSFVALLFHLNLVPLSWITRRFKKQVNRSFHLVSPLNIWEWKATAKKTTIIKLSSEENSP